MQAGSDHVYYSYPSHPHKNPATQAPADSGKQDQVCAFFYSEMQTVLNWYIPYSAYITRIFNFANFANFESFAKLIQLKFEPPGHAHAQVHIIFTAWLDLTTATAKGSRGFAGSLAKISSSPIDGVQISL